MSGQSRKNRLALRSLAVVITLCLVPVISRGEEFLEEFEGPAPSWKIATRTKDTSVAIHQRRRGAGQSGGAEFVRFNVVRENSQVILDHPVPQSTVLDEFEASLWVRSNCNGFLLKVLVILPEIIDPDTNKPVVMFVPGDSYQRTGQWQQLKCRTSDRAVSDQLRQLRARKQIAINPKVMYVERVVLDAQLPPGEADLFLDDMVLSPMVRFRSKDTVNSPEVEQASHARDETKSGPPQSPSPVKFSLHRLQVGEKPFFPRIIKSHQERPELLASAGMNVVWVADYDNPAVTGPLRRQGLWITSVPPYAKGLDGEPLDSDDASLLPFQSNTSPVLFWMLGDRLKPDGRPRIASWANQIRNADRQFNKRPIAADVIENERFCSRHVDLLGISRHMVNTGCSFVDYRDWLIQRRSQARPDTFCWTWIQTEVASALTEMSQGLEAPPMLEPEQIRLQVYAALAAGCRGLGYWTTTPLDEDTPAARERLLTLTQLNLELELFEPWITAGGTPQLVSFRVDAPRNDRMPNATKSNRQEITGRASGPLAKRVEREQHAAMIRTEQGALLLPMWLEENAQFTPGPMTARNVSIIVPGGGETASAWEITTTGQLRNLEREPAAGGVLIKLPRFDQTAAVLITSKHSMVEQLNQKIASIQERSARVSVDLAKLKLERVRQVDQTLQSLGAERLDSWQWLGDAKLHFDKAESALQAHQYADARLFAAEALQYGRYLQRAHWENAVKRQRSPTSIPWAVSFQSLPEYWRLTRRLQNLDPAESKRNLLPSGEFEDLSTMLAEHWRHVQELVDSVQSNADLYRVAKQGEYCLKLTARPISGEALPSLIAKAPVAMISPGVSVPAGQVVRITGWVRIPTPLVGSIDGAMIYDSLLGKAGAIHLNSTQEWQQFELIRPCNESQDVTVTLALHGLGELMVDDLCIAAFEPGPEVSAPNTTKSPIESTRYSPLRRMIPLQKR